jgi:hypothetical protein
MYSATLRSSLFSRVSAVVLTWSITSLALFNSIAGRDIVNEEENDEATVAAAAAADDDDDEDDAEAEIEDRFDISEFA